MLTPAGYQALIALLATFRKLYSSNSQKPPSIFQTRCTDGQFTPIFLLPVLLSLDLKSWSAHTPHKCL